MRKLPLIAFALLLILAAAWIVSLTSHLPDRVATHFDAAGTPNGLMTRAQCRAFMLAFTLGAPTLIAAALGGIPRFVPTSMLNLPNRDYWLDPSRIESVLADLGAQGVWFACVLLVFLMTVDGYVAAANAAAPAHLPMPSFLWVFGAFVVASLGWVVRMVARFRVPAR